MGLPEQILDRARWAPSGDNTQPWRFEIVADDHVAVHGFDTRGWCLYDFDGHASHMAHGALLETLRIAATAVGVRATWALRPGTPESAPVYDVKLTHEPGCPVDPLNAYIETRTVQRRPMRTAPLTASQREVLARAVGAEYEVLFYDRVSEKLAIGRLLSQNGHVRLTCPEAYEVHKRIIEWEARFSKDRIPDQAIGLDTVTLKLMRWVMQSSNRVSFFNRYLLGTSVPRLQLDFLPAVFCGTHVLVRTKSKRRTVEDYVRSGIAMQRLWLSAAALGLHLQPQMTPLIFRWYARAGREFSASPKILERVTTLAASLESLFQVGPEDDLTFFCRVGASKGPHARSHRMDLRELMHTNASVQ